MSKIKVGDRVVCIKQHHSYPVLKVGREYIVGDIDFCCDDYSFDIGIPNLPEHSCRCGNCKRIVSTTDENFYFDSPHFRKVEEKKEVQYVKLEVKIVEPVLN